MSSDADLNFFEGLVEKKAEEPNPPSAPPTQPAPRIPTSRSIFSHPDAHPVALDLALLKHFQLEWLQWLPDTLFHEIEQTFKTSIAEINKLKILATQTLHVVDSFWEEWEIFEKTLWALNGTVPLVRLVQPPDLPILFAGVDIASSIREEKFSEEVARYCAAVFLNENVHYAAPPLDFCQRYLSNPYYICKDCGKHGDLIEPFDGLCTSCAGHYDTEHPFSFKPDPEAINRGAGKNISIHLTYEYEHVRERFNTLNAMAPDKVASSIREVSEDIQAAKLITAVDFMEYRKKQLNDQMSTLKDWLESV
jgi:hypothetical protein